VGEGGFVEGIITTPTEDADENRESADDREMDGPAARVNLGNGRSIQWG